MLRLLKGFLFVLFIIFPLSSFAWWGTTHQVVAQIAYNHLSSDTQREVESLLQIPLDWPEAAPNKYLSEPEILSQQLNTVRLASTWADAIKIYDWDGKSGNQLRDTYSNLHFIDTPITSTARQSCATVNWLLLVNSEDQTSQGNNVVTGIKRVIKTLELPDESQANKAIALRFLLHFVGDLHMPFHASDPKFELRQHQFGTAGANNINFSDRPIFLYQSSPFGMNQLKVIEFHQLWDAAVGDYSNIPDNYNSSYDLLGRLSWAAWAHFYNTIMAYRAFYIEHRFAEDNDLNQKIKNDPDINHWAADVAKQACDLLSNPTYQLKFTPYAVRIHNQTEYDVRLRFLDGFSNYQRQTEMVVFRQIYMAGLRLAYVLNAIFSEEGAQNSSFKSYIQTNIVNNAQIKPFDFL